MNSAYCGAADRMFPLRAFQLLTGSRFEGGIYLKRNYHIPRNIVGAILDLVWSAQIAEARMGSYVTAIPAASSDIAAKHFAHRLTVETDCADVADAMRNDLQDFVLLTL
jgi:hypothetical protein